MQRILRCCHTPARCNLQVYRPGVIFFAALTRSLRLTDRGNQQHTLPFGTTIAFYLFFTFV